MLKKMLIAVVLMGALGFWYWTTTPQWAVWQIRSAIKSHDLATFQKYTDLDSVAGRMVDDVLTKPVQAALGPGIVGHLLGFGLGVFVKPILVSGMKEDIKDFVTGGTGKTSYEHDGTRSASTGTFKSIPSELGFSGKVYRGMEYVRTEGKICLVGIKLHNEKYDSDLVLDLKLSDAGGYWRLIELSNLQELMGKIVDLQMRGSSETQSMLIPAPPGSAGFQPALTKILLQ